MKRICSARSRFAYTLIETTIVAAVMGIVALLGFEIMIRGAQYLRVNQLAIDAQRSGLILLTQLHGDLQSSQFDLVTSRPDGVVFPLPFKDDGTTEFAPLTQHVLWQRWVYYAYDADGHTVSRMEKRITPPKEVPGLAPPSADFAGLPGAHLLAQHISEFTVTQHLPLTLHLLDIAATAGDMNDTSGYGVKLALTVSPRNVDTP